MGRERTSRLVALSVHSLSLCVLVSQYVVCHASFPHWLLAIDSVPCQGRLSIGSLSVLRTWQLALPTMMALRELARKRTSSIETAVFYNLI